MECRRFLSLEGAHALCLRRLLPKRVELSRLGALLKLRHDRLQHQLGALRALRRCRLGLHTRRPPMRAA